MRMKCVYFQNVLQLLENKLATGGDEGGLLPFLNVANDIKIRFIILAMGVCLQTLIVYSGWPTSAVVSPK